MSTTDLPRSDQIVRRLILPFTSAKAVDHAGATFCCVWNGKDETCLVLLDMERAGVLHIAAATRRIPAFTDVRALVTGAERQQWCPPHSALRLFIKVHALHNDHAFHASFIPVPVMRTGSEPKSVAPATSKETGKSSFLGCSVLGKCHTSCCTARQQQYLAYS